MMSTIDILRTPRVELAGGQIEFLTDVGQIALVTDATRASVDASRLLSDRMVAAWSNENWCCLVGFRASEVIVAVPSEGRIENAGQLDRLDLEDAYDPGGLHRVEFKPLEQDDVLLIHEFGAARISPTAGIVWQRTHRDLTARLERIDEDRAVLHAESGSFAYDLRDGRDVRL